MEKISGKVQQHLEMKVKGNSLESKYLTTIKERQLPRNMGFHFRCYGSQYKKIVTPDGF